MDGLTVTGFWFKLLVKVEDWITILAAVAIAAMMVITTTDVIARRAFDIHVKGSYEFVMLLFVYVIFFGLAYCQRQDSHITVGILYDRLTKKARRSIEGVVLVISFVLFALITWHSALSAWFNLQAGDTILGAMPVLTWPSRIGVPVGTGLLSLRLLVQIVRLVMRGELYEEVVVREESAKRGAGT